MGRCGGWIKGMALFLVALSISCGDTGGKKSSSTGKVFCFSGAGTAESGSPGRSR